MAHHRLSHSCLCTSLTHGWCRLQAFVHAAWAPDENEATLGEDEPEEQAQRQKQQEAEQAGFCKFGERTGALHDCVGSLPPPAWWQDVTDSQLAVGFGEGAAAARVHALVSPLWWVDMSPTNKALVVVRDSGLTLFSASDEFSSPRADWEGLPVSGERGFQWRRVAWSQDGSILAVSEANGSATILAVNTFRATARISTLLPTRSPAVAIAFLQLASSDSAAPVHALLALSYACVLYTHPVATAVQRAKDGPSVAVAAPLDLSGYHSNVTCLTVAPGQSMIAIGGWDVPSGSAARAAPSVSVWKASSDGNSYALHFSANNTGGGGNGAKGSFLARAMDTVRAAVSRGRWALDSSIAKLSFDPSGRLLVALELSGTIHVIDCVGCSVSHRFSAQDIPAPVAGADVAVPPSFEGRSSSWLASVGDVSWWDGSSLVLSRRNGVVTVNNIKDGLANVLKAPLGPFHFQPVITNAISSVEGSMFVLDCRRRLGTRDLDGGEEVGASFGATDSRPWLSRVLSGQSASAGDRAGIGGKFVRRYRLISVCKTTVERLLQRKLDLRDYSAALNVAKQHSLAVDCVYQRQWERSSVSEQSIREFLAKVSDRGWVIEECRSRLPRSREGAILLSKYGIERCEAALADTSELDDREQTAHIQRCHDVLKRRLDWLEIYELIYPGDTLDPSRLKWFCESDNLQVARLLALEEECHALAVLLKRYRDELAPKWLEILSCIPETCRPRQYEQLLPCVPSRQGSGETDNSAATDLVPANEAAAWYVNRAREIERCTGLVDNALELLEVGEQRLRSSSPIPALSELRTDLSHLYMLVYECGMDDLTLKSWHAKSLMERLCCFTDKSTTDTFVANLRDRAGPYLAALGPAVGEKLLCDYLSDIASSRLDWCAEVFKASTVEEPLYTFATSNPVGSALREWKRIVPAHFAAWAPSPEDNVQGQINDDVIIVHFEQEVPVREQVVLWAGSAAGTCAGVMVVVCSNDKEVQAVVTLTDPTPKAVSSENDNAAEDQPGKASMDMLGPRPTLPVCAVAVELIAGHTRARVCRHRVLYDPVTMVDVALRCVYACSTVDDVMAKAMGDIYCTLPKRDSSLVGSVADAKKYQELQDRADRFDQHLTAIEVLRAYKLYKPLAFFEEAASDHDACIALMKAMCRFQVRQERRSESAFRQLHVDLMGPPNPPSDFGGLMHSVFSFLPPTVCNVIFLESLLDANFFELAREVLEVELERDGEVDAACAAAEGAEAGSRRSSLADCVFVLLKVAREYFDSASSCHDGVWANARQCLHLIPLDEQEEQEQEDDASADSAPPTPATSEGARKHWQQELRRERKLIEAVEMLDSLGISDTRAHTYKHVWVLAARRAEGSQS